MSLPMVAPDINAELLACYERLMVQALKLESSAPAAFDLLQDTCERVMRSRERFVAGTNFFQWSYRIMFNLFIDRYRHRSKERPLMAEESYAATCEEPPAIWRFLEPDDLLVALQRLPEPFRTTAELRFRGVHYREIARTTGVPIQTVGSRLSRARLELKSLLVDVLAERGIYVPAIANLPEPLLAAAS